MSCTSQRQKAEEMKHKCYVKIKFDPEIKNIQYYVFCFTCKPFNIDNLEEEPIELYCTPFFDYAMCYSINHYNIKKLDELYQWHPR